QKALTMGIANVRRTLEESAGLVAGTLRDRVTQAREELEAEANRISTMLGEGNQGLTQRLADLLAEQQQKVTNDLAGYEAQMAERTEALRKLIDETAQPLVDRLSGEGEAVAGKLEAATRAAAERLKSENEALVNAMASQTADTVSTLTSMQSGLSENVTDLLDRLSASNARLGGLIDMASQNLGELDGKLDTNTRAFIENTTAAADRIESTSSNLSQRTESISSRLTSTAQQLSDNTSRLEEISQGSLSTISSIATRFDDHGRMLQAASELLGSANENIVGTLQERSEAIDRLAMGLAAKSDEIRSTMTGFENVVTAAFSTIESRTDSVAQGLASSVQNNTEEAIRRFEDASAEMRQIASGIRNELAQARDDIKQGIFDLPDETRQSTDAMRRAVAEQINALKDLSSIVERSGRAFDVGGASAKKPTARSDAGSVSARSGQNTAPVRPQPAAPQRPLEPAGGLPPIPRKPAPAAPAAPSLRGSLQPTPARENSNNSWVSDLLRAASDEPVNAAPNLGNLSNDIAKAIDSGQASAAWSRYRNGERGAFTRRLYTLEGQRTFDEIASKYQQQRSFRDAVNRYMNDFEELLRDASKNDPTDEMVQAYLTSETGKVYTMLAHAAGRLN
ncbi:MAG: kinesin, partial [Ahrensia sp.]